MRRRPGARIGPRLPGRQPRPRHRRRARNAARRPARRRLPRPSSSTCGDSPSWTTGMRLLLRWSAGTRADGIALGIAPECRRCNASSRSPAPRTSCPSVDPLPIDGHPRGADLLSASTATRRVEPGHGPARARARPGAVRTAMPNAVTYLDVVVRARPPSAVPDDGAQRTADRLGLALGARSACRGHAQERPRRPHGGTRDGLRRRRRAATDTASVRLGVTDPAGWSAADWAADVVPHLAYGAGVVLDLRRARRRPAPLISAGAPKGTRPGPAGGRHANPPGAARPGASARRTHPSAGRTVAAPARRDAQRAPAEGADAHARSKEMVVRTWT